jgi:hypothetical protein
LDVSRLFVAGHIIGDNKVKSLFLKQEGRKEKDRVFSRNNSDDSDLSNYDVLVKQSASVLLIRFFYDLFIVHLYMWYINCCWSLNSFISKNLIESGEKW